MHEKWYHNLVMTQLAGLNVLVYPILQTPTDDFKRQTHARPAVHKIVYVEQTILLYYANKPYECLSGIMEIKRIYRKTILFTSIVFILDSEQSEKLKGKHFLRIYYHIFFFFFWLQK